MILPNLHRHSPFSSFFVNKNIVTRSKRNFLQPLDILKETNYKGQFLQHSPSKFLPPLVPTKPSLFNAQRSPLTANIS